MKIVKSEQDYIVECGEEEWYPKTPEERDVLLSAMQVDAAAANCFKLTVFVNPDPILPAFGIDRKTRVHSEKLASDTPYELSITYHAELAPDAWDTMEPSQQKVTMREILDNLARKGHRNPGRYEVYVMRNGVKDYVQRGRV